MRRPPNRGPGVGVTGGFLVRHAGLRRRRCGGDEGVAEGVGSDGLVDPPSATTEPTFPLSGMPVERSSSPPSSQEPPGRAPARPSGEFRSPAAVDPGEPSPRSAEPRTVVLLGRSGALRLGCLRPRAPPTGTYGRCQSEAATAIMGRLTRAFRRAISRAQQRPNCPPSLPTQNQPPLKSRATTQPHGDTDVSVGPKGAGLTSSAQVERIRTRLSHVTRASSIEGCPAGTCLSSPAGPPHRARRSGASSWNFPPSELRRM